LLTVFWLPHPLSHQPKRDLPASHRRVPACPKFFREPPLPPSRLLTERRSRRHSIPLPRCETRTHATPAAYLIQPSSRIQAGYRSKQSFLAKIFLVINSLLFSHSAYPHLFATSRMLAINATSTMMASARAPVNSKSTRGLAARSVGSKFMSGSTNAAASLRVAPRLSSNNKPSRGAALVVEANLFNRLGRVIGSYANSLVSAAEDPEKILDQAVGGPCTSTSRSQLTTRGFPPHSLRAPGFNHY
jgi:hypothetical protein